MPIQRRSMEESCLPQLVEEAGAWKNLLKLADDLLKERKLKMEMQKQKDSLEDQFGLQNKQEAYMCPA